MEDDPVAAVIGQLLARAHANLSARHIHNNNQNRHDMGDEKQCLVCGLRARFREQGRADHVFCDAEPCQLAHHKLGQFFDLGMKRVRRQQQPVHPIELPDEIVCSLVLLAFNARLDSRREYEAMRQLRRTNEQFRRVIDACVLPQIRELADDIVAAMPLDALLHFRSLVRLLVSAESHRGIRQRDAPRALQVLTRLEALRVIDEEYHTYMETLTTDRLVRLPRLTSLELDRAPVQDELLQALPRLTYLALGESGATVTNAGLTKLTALETLVLFSDELQGIVDLSPLVSLKRLSCKRGHCRVDIHTLRDLTLLDMGREWYGYDDAVLGAMSTLQHLSISFSGQVTDAAVGRLTGLRSLHLHWAQQITLESISRLTNLEALCIEYGSDAVRLNALTAAMLAPTLTVLITHQDVRPSAQALWQLVNLTHLDLSRNYGHIMDWVLARLVNLRTLILSRDTGINGLESFAYLTALTALDLSENIEVTNGALALLPQLRVLDLTGNRVITANTVTLLQQLTTLFLVENREVTLTALSKLPALRYVAHNSARKVKRSAAPGLWDRLEAAGVEFHDEPHPEETKRMHQFHLVVKEWAPLRRYI